MPAGALPPALWAGLLAAALAGGILLIAADFSTLYEVKAITAVLKRQSGHAQHSYGLLVLGIAALGMTFGAARGRSRPALAAVGAIGLLALLIVLIGDLHDVNATGVYGQRFESAAANPKAGFYLETLGAILLLATGGSAIVLTAPARLARVRAQPTIGEGEETETPEETSAPARAAAAPEDELDVEWEDMPSRRRAAESEPADEPFAAEAPPGPVGALQGWLRKAFGRSDSGSGR